MLLLNAKKNEKWNCASISSPVRLGVFCKNKVHEIFIFRSVLTNVLMLLSHGCKDTFGAYFAVFDLHAQYEIIKATNITTPTLSKTISTVPRRFIFPVTWLLNISAFSSPTVPVCNQVNNSIIWVDKWRVWSILLH